jgi:small subunit ribosomal protein S3Ae
MAAKPKKGKAVDKWRKKKYFSVLAPKIFQERELGQTIAYDSSSLEGRRMCTNLMTLTGNIKNQHIVITFKVNRVQGDTAFTMVEKCEVVPSALKRKVRRQRNRLDESFQCVTKDNKIIRIKPLIITRGKTSRSVLSALRKAVLQFVVNSVRKADYDYLVMDIITNKFQRSIANSINKIMPVRSVDIRVMKYLGEQKAAAVEASAEELVEKTEELKKEEKAKAKKEGKKKAEKAAEEPPEPKEEKAAGEPEAQAQPGEKTVEPKDVPEVPAEPAEEAKPAAT